MEWNGWMDGWYVCLYVCLFVCLSVCLSEICLFVCLSVCLSVCVFICSFQTPSLLFALQFGTFHSRSFRIPLLLSQVHEEWSKCMLKASLEAGSSMIPYGFVSKLGTPKIDGSPSFQHDMFQPLELLMLYSGAPSLETNPERERERDIKAYTLP